MIERETKRRAPLEYITGVKNLYTFPPFPLLFIDEKGLIYRQQGRHLKRLKWCKLKGVTTLGLSYEGFRAKLTYEWACNIRDRFGTPVHWNGQAMFRDHIDLPSAANGA